MMWASDIVSATPAANGGDDPTVNVACFWADDHISRVRKTLYLHSI